MDIWGVGAGGMDPGLAGITGPGPVASRGGKGQVPSLAAVMAQLERHLSH